MRRTVAVVLGAGALALSGLALGPAVRAQQKQGEARAVEKDVTRKTDKEEGRKVQKRVVVQHAGSGFLGVTLGDLEGEGRGAKVRAVEKDTPAEKAGLKEDDVIVRFDGEAVRSAAHLSRLVGETPAGRSVAVEVTRAGATQKLTATLGERRMRVFDGEDFPGMGSFRFELPEPPEPPEAPHAGTAPHGLLAPGTPHAWGFRYDGDRMTLKGFPGLAGPRKLGLEYIDMGEQLAAAYRLAEKGGVLVSSVDADGPAAKAGVKAGDVILKFDGKAIKDAGDLRDAVAAAEAGKDVALTVQRDGKPIEIKATLAKPEVKHRRTSGVTL